MKLHRLLIIASPDDHPGITNSFVWTDGKDVAELELAIAKLQQYVDSRKETLKTALSHQPTLPADLT